MKKGIAALVLVVCIFALSGCGQNGAASSGSGESAQSTAGQQSAQETEWTAQELKTQFLEKNTNRNWTVIDCVPASDLAYDRVGVVLFTDSEKKTSNTAFMDKDGNCQQCGLYADVYSDPQLTYCGNGVVTFQLKTEEGTPNPYRISFSMEGPDVSFVAEDLPQD